MNVERLHEIAKAIRADLSTTRTVRTLEALTSALQDVVNSPQQAQPQQELSTQLSHLIEALGASASNDFSPTWKQVAEEIGAYDLLGNTLKERIEAIFATNQITPSVALAELQLIKKAAESLYANLDQLVKALEALGIGSEPLQGTDCEVGVLIPRGFVDNRLDRLGSELSELNKIFGVFAEVASGNRPGFKVRTISSSDFNVYIEAIPAVAACIAVAVERIIATYKNLLDIRKHHRELAELGLPAENLEGIQGHANTLMQSEIDKIDKELLNEFLRQKDVGRMNELEIELRMSMSKIANRIDRGFNIEVRVPPQIAAPADDAPPHDPQDIQHIQSIREASETLEFIKLEGPPILKLPENSNNREKATGRKKDHLPKPVEGDNKAA